MNIDLGRIFSWLFKRKKKGEIQNIEWQQLTNDAVLNCCEQIGVFEGLNIEDENLVNKICEDVARLFNNGEKSEESLKNAFIQGFSNNSFNVGIKKADMFVDCYIESYINQ
ncbi:MAG: hypothetical protein IKY10_03910 [Clostridia bacterium]|nr:hypothetical protein [Clostridia bacterium]